MAVTALTTETVLAIAGLAIGLVDVTMSAADLFPKNDKHETMVRIGVGESLESADSTGGNMPGVTLYDAVGRLIGMTTGHAKQVRDGGWTDIKVPFHDKDKMPTEYLSITDGGDDGLCIAYIGLTQPNGDHIIWLGDVGKDCGANWYPSPLKIGASLHQPPCVWIDRNYSNGNRYQAIGMHIVDFVATEARRKQYNASIDLMCNSAPRFKMYERFASLDPIPFFDPPLEYVPGTLTDKDPAAVLDKTHWRLEPHNSPKLHLGARQMLRGSPGKKATVGNKVVISNSPSASHSAKGLCEDPNSRGNDFASTVEGLFCDMDTRILWPFCSEDTSTGCFDADTSTMKAGNTLQGRDVNTGAVLPTKDYKKTVRWDFYA